MPSKSRYLICVFGPTAIGKTALTLELANWLDTDIISADSRQFYREMSIGTAKPTETELTDTQHHFINSHSINEEFSAGDFEKQTLNLLIDLFNSKDVVLMTGGSGLYIKAVTDGLPDMPNVQKEIRSELKLELEKKGLQLLLDELEKVDKTYFNEVDKDNPQRVVRGLEVYRSTGIPFSQFRDNESVSRPFKIIKIGLDMPREDLYDRINRRVDYMIEDGLVEEVRTLSNYREKQALQTVGYKEIFDYLDGKMSLDESIELVKRNTRRYAKRQLTWFRKEQGVNWFSPNELEKIKSYIETILIN